MAQFILQYFIVMSNLNILITFTCISGLIFIFLIETSLFRKSTLNSGEYTAELKEINKHKWLESEKLGYDIGFEKAEQSWANQHKHNWVKSRGFHA